MQDVNTDMTTRKTVCDARDSGGRLGPANNEKAADPLYCADLSNLSLFGLPCEEGDLIVLMTDGVHDNLDPQHLGKRPVDMPRSMNLEPVESWENVDQEKAEQA